MPSLPTRRRFLQTAGLASAALVTAPWIRSETLPDSPYRNLVRGRKVRVACVGVGGKGHEDTMNCSGEELVGLCDVDFARGAQTFQLFPQVPRFRDYRVMLDQLHDRIDAVTISTPDHMHAPIALAAMERGKHVYVQKPLTHTIGEARLLKAAAAKAGVVTQMGNQGHAFDGCRLIKEWIEAGAIGQVREVHCWTNRPVWPQGIAWPAPDVRPPDTLDWNLWLGVAPHRPYVKDVAPFNWRGFWDYGCGAMGDMGCHVLDAPFWALNLRGPVKVRGESEGNTAICAPKSSHVVMEFPARGNLAPLVLTWSDGGRLPARPPGLDPEEKLPGSGTYYVGDAGILYSPGDYSTSPRLLPESRMESFKRPARGIPRIPKGNPYLEWLTAIKGGPVPGSNIIDHSADLTEFTLLGNLAIRLGRSFEWDPVAVACVGQPDADRLIHKTYRVF